MIVLVIGAIAGYAFYLNNQVTRIQVHHLSKGPTKGADVGTENILMVGSTSRCALAQQNPAYGLCSQGVTGVNSDVIMILHLNPNTHSVSILSIPRDLFVPNGRPSGAEKIDAALADGPSQLVAAIEEDFGIPIQHYVELNFDTFANVVNALGGINMYFPEPVYDAYSGLDVKTTGCLHLNGYEALQVVRARHLQYKGPGVTSNDPADWPYEAQSDLARIRRDHEFLRVLATAVQKQGLGNPITDQHLVAGLVGQLTVDQGFSASEMVSLVLTYHGVSVNKAPQLTLPVLVDNDLDGYYYKGGNYGDIEFPSEPQDQQVIDQVLGDGGASDTLNGGALPAPKHVTVSVLNGTDSDSEPSQTSSALQQLGFNVVGTGYAVPVGDYAETTVSYSSRTPADEAAAQEVARSLSGAVILKYGPTTDGAQVTVTTGTNFSVNSTAPTPTTTTTHPKTSKKTSKTSKASATTAPASAPGAAAGTTTTTIPSDIASGAFSPASSSNEPLAPWDPRACPTSTGTSSGAKKK